MDKDFISLVLLTKDLVWLYNNYKGMPETLTKAVDIALTNYINDDAIGIVVKTIEPAAKAALLAILTPLEYELEDQPGVTRLICELSDSLDLS
jgi:hypothetical protein